jgi:hypothetical protein
MRRKFLAVLLLPLLAGPVLGRDLIWQKLDTLAGGDRALAEQTLYEEFGDDPEQWPDWIDPAALYVPVGNDRLLIVRRPVHAPCGQYSFAMLSPITPALSRDKLGDFCAGSLQVITVTGRAWPDFLVTEGRQQDASGDWQRFDQRLRWRDGQWWRIIAAEE